MEATPNTATFAVQPAERRILPWAKMGTEFAQPVASAREAAARVGILDVPITTENLYWKTAEGLDFPVEGRKVLVRHPYGDEKDAFVREVTGEHYQVLSNRAICTALDEAKITERWPVQTIGATNNGLGLIVVLDMGGADILHEAHHRYAILKDPRDGGSGLVMEMLYIRWACTNGLTIPVNQEEKISLTHDRHLEGDFRLSLSLIDQVEVIASRAKQYLLNLADTPVFDEDLPDLFAHVYPTPLKGRLLKTYEGLDDLSRVDPAQVERLKGMAESHQYLLAATEGLRKAALRRYGVLSLEHPVHAGRGIGVYNAVCEVADHTRGHRQGTSASLDGYRAAEKVRCASYLMGMYNATAGLA